MCAEWEQACVRSRPGASRLGQGGKPAAWPRDTWNILYLSEPPEPPCPFGLNLPCGVSEGEREIARGHSHTPFALSPPPTMEASLPVGRGGLGRFFLLADEA